ncbi:MAG: hypothetical protein AMJ43_04885 [Coxiella sp. DG_40]|nr:MAG: hypothetical protein AMJ43_04885 [Coxiella sp. DG_40]
MKNNKFIIFLSALLLLYTISIQAVIVSSLYEVQLPVTDLSDQTRLQAFSKALQQVLIKVTGNVAIATLPEIQSELESAESLISSYSYIENDDKTLLDVKFNHKEVQQILRNAKQALWGDNRPPIIIWLDVDDGNSNNILASNSDSFLVSVLNNNADRLGLPIVLPEMDSQDLNNISTNDIEQTNLSAIQTCSQRYDVNTILVGYISKSSQTNWQSKWTLLTNGNTENWVITGDDIEQILTKATNNVASILASQFAILNDNALQTQLTVIVTGITNLDEYAALVKYLHSLNTITDIEPVTISPDQIKFQVTSTDGAQGLTNAINHSDKLVTIPFIQDTKADLFYHWTQD